MSDGRRASSGNSASSSGTKPGSSDEGYVFVERQGPAIDPGEPFRWVWSLLLAPLVKVESMFSDGVLLNVLPLAFELAGRDNVADMIREVLTRGHPKRAMLVGAFGAVSLLIAAIVAIVLKSVLKSVFENYVITFAVGTINYTKSFVYHTLWRPQWWGTIPSMIGIITQRKVIWAQVLWPHFLLLYCANGGWWGVAACLLTTFVCAVTALAFWINCAFFLVFELAVRNGWLPWYVKGVFGLIILVAWGFLALLALAGVARAQAEERVLGSDPNSPILQAKDYPDAEGEVKRVLLCTEYFSVLEVPVTADDSEIKISYRKKIVSTHPDKNPNAKHCNEAFDRVKTAYEKIGAEKERSKYLEDLMQAHGVLQSYNNEHYSQQSSGYESQKTSRRPEPAPRSHGPKGRKGRKGRRH